MAAPLNGHEKSAILLSLIGEETAAEILKSLDMKEVGKITAHMSRLKVIKKETADTVLQEVSEIISKNDIQFVAGEEYLKKVLSKGFSDADANKVLERAMKDDPLDSLRGVDPWALSNILMGEHPQTIAFILCMLDPMRAAEVLSLLNEELRANVAMRIATTDRIPESAIDEIREVFDDRLYMGVGATGIKVGGMKAIAEIMNHSDRSTEESVFLKLEEKDKNLADSIRELMFVFEDIIDLDDRYIQTVLKEVNTEELSLALKTASNELKTKLFKNMSQRAAEILKDDIATKGPVRVSDVEKSQLMVMEVVRKLERDGKIVIARFGGGDVVV